LREARGVRRWQLGAGWAGTVGMSVMFAVVLGVAVAHAQPPAPPSYFSVEAVHTEASDTTPNTDERDSSTPPEKTDTAASTTTLEPSEAMERTVPTFTSAATPAPAGRVTAIGDSVMVGAAGELQRAIGSNLDIDAEVGRQAPAVIEILQKRRAAGQLGEIVVIHIGSNGAFNAEQFDEMMRSLASVRKVVFVNVKVSRPWEQPNNDVLADGVQRYSNAILVDWHAMSASRPELFVEDGYHLQIEGQRIYADLIAAQTEAS
jgi:lysophospholipase L1-like esterase